VTLQKRSDEHTIKAHTQVWDADEGSRAGLCETIALYHRCAHRDLQELLHMPCSQHMPDYVYLYIPLVSPPSVERKAFIMPLRVAGHHL